MKAPATPSFLRRIPLFYRLMILTMLVVGAGAGLLIWVNTPTVHEALTANVWCLDSAAFDNRPIFPQTALYIKLIGAGFCDESVEFKKGGAVVLPGFQSRSAVGRWVLNDDEVLIVSGVDTFGSIYNGRFRTELSGNQLLLKSEKTTLVCHAQDIRVDLPF